MKMMKKKYLSLMVSLKKIGVEVMVIHPIQELEFTIMEVEEHIPQTQITQLNVGINLLVKIIAEIQIPVQIHHQQVQTIIQVLVSHNTKTKNH